MARARGECAKALLASGLGRQYRKPSRFRPHRAARARSSAVEHYLDMVGVTGSIPVAPTILINTWHALSTRAGIRDERAMKVKNSIKSLRGRHRDCQVVRRRGRLYVINKTQRRFKARQG